MGVNQSSGMASEIRLPLRLRKFRPSQLDVQTGIPGVPAGEARVRLTERIGSSNCVDVPKNVWHHEHGRHGAPGTKYL